MIDGAISRVLVVCLAGVLAAVISGVPADAAQQVTIGATGNSTRCQAGSPGPYDAVQAAAAAGGPTYAVPTGGGSITSFSTQAGSDGGVLELEVWRPTSTANTYTLVGISPPKTLTANSLNTFSLSPPIVAQGGDLLGFRQESQYLDCGWITGNSGDVWSTNHMPGSQPPTVGASETLQQQANLRINISATVRPRHGQHG